MQPFRTKGAKLLKLRACINYLGINISRAFHCSTGKSIGKIKYFKWKALKCTFLHDFNTIISVFVYIYNVIWIEKSQNATFFFGRRLQTKPLYINVQAFNFVSHTHSSSAIGCVLPQQNKEISWNEKKIWINKKKPAETV